MRRSVSPRAPVKDARNRRQNHIAPVEVQRALVEMRQPKQTSGHDAAPSVRPTRRSSRFCIQPRKKISSGSAIPTKVKIHIGHDQKRPSESVMQVEKSEHQPQRNCDRPRRTTNSRRPIFQSRRRSRRSKPTPLNCRTARKPYSPASSKREFADERKMRRPGRFQPAQIDRQPQRYQHHEIQDVATLLRIQLRCPSQERGNRDRSQSVNRQPFHAKRVRGCADDAIRQRQDGRQTQPHSQRQPLRLANAGLPGKPKGKQRHERQNQRNHGGNQRKGQRHILMVRLPLCPDFRSFGRPELTRKRAGCNVRSSVLANFVRI